MALLQKLSNERTTLDLRHSLVAGVTVLGLRRGLQRPPALRRWVHHKCGRAGVFLEGRGYDGDQRGAILQGNGPQLVHAVKGCVKVVMATAVVSARDFQREEELEP